MHRHLQFDVRENPASDRRHGSRSAVSTKPASHYIVEENEEALVTAALAEQVTANARISEHAATSWAATVGEGGEASKTEPSFRYNGSAVERPLTCEEAAAFVRVHPKTVKRMARSGGLPGHFRFGRWFFYASELDCWMRTELHSSRHSCR